MTANRITQHFARKPNDNVCIYFTAGYPALHDTTEILQALQDAGADLVEIGIPFSDPLADGLTIQQSSKVAIQNGMTLKLLLAQLKDMRNTIHLPVLLMGYFNSVLQFGVEAFCKAASAAGIDGIIIPDLPLDVYQTQHQSIFQQYGLCNIFMITAYSTPEDIKRYDATGSGFLYLVSAAATTGNENIPLYTQAAYTTFASNLQVQLPVLTGFGISSNQDIDTAYRYSNGAIIGSAFIRALDKNSNVTHATSAFMHSLFTPSILSS